MLYISNGIQTVPFRSAEVIQIETEKLRTLKREVMRMRRHNKHDVAQLLVNSVRGDVDSYYKYQVAINGNTWLFGIKKETAMNIVGQINHVAGMNNVRVINFKKICESCKIHASYVKTEYDGIVNEVYGGETR